MNWGDFIYAMGCLAGLEKKSPGLTTVPFPTLEMYSKLRGPVHQNMSMTDWAKDRTIYQVLIRTRHLDSGDHRDKLYGLFGYFVKLGVQGLPPVDYNLEVSQIYTDFTRFAIVHAQSLRLLYELDGFEGPHTLPSWTPDWSRAYKNSRISWQPQESYQSTQASSPIFDFKPDNELHAQGVILSKINIRADSGTMPATKPEDTIPNIISRVRTWQQWVFMALTATAYPNEQHVINTLLRTMLRNMVSDAEVEYFSAWYNILTAYDPRNLLGAECIVHIDDAVQWALERPAIWALYFTGDVDPVPIINTPEWRVMVALADARDANLQSLHLKIYNQTMGMAVFITEDGYLGVSSDALKVGDEIALISGLSLPMVVRRVEDATFRFVAPAYVHGIMDGEKWPMNGREGLQNLIFT